ncbi:Hypothetical predicted protein, partial [Paramuricea clavata]
KRGCERALSNATKELIRHIKSCKIHELFDSTENGTVVVEINTTSLDHLHEWRENITSLPNMTIQQLCEKQPNCK